MKRFLGFIKKEMYHIWRDKRSLFILFGMPIIQILLFGFAITNEIKQVNIAVLDQSNDVMTQQLINKVDQSSYFHIQRVLHHPKELEESFKTGDIKAALVIAPETGKSLTTEPKTTLQVITDATEPNTAIAIFNYLQAIISQFQKEYTDFSILPIQIVTQTKMRYNPELKSVYMFVPGVMTIILMLVSAMMTSISIAREKELGTMEVLLVSPLKPLQVILGKVTPYILLSIINATFILLLGFFVFKMPMEGSMILLAFESVIFIITALSLGILISSVTKSQQQAMLLSMVGLLLPTMLLSGFIFPITSMPRLLQILSNIVPARWFIEILKGVMLKGSDITFLWKETIILLGMTLFFLVLSIKNYKIRLE